jgi:hypothetical protein
MGYWRCEKCNGCGTLPAPNRRWWQWWERFTCPDCMGDGHARPPKNRQVTGFTTSREFVQAVIKASQGGVTDDPRLQALEKDGERERWAAVENEMTKRGRQKVWLAVQVGSCPDPEPPYPLEIIGVFWTAKEARAACTDPSDCIGPLMIGDVAPPDSVFVERPGACHPLRGI